MQRKFIFNLLLLVAINLLVKPLAIFGIDAEVQNRIGYEDYGVYFSLFNFTYIFNILLDLGITNFNIKNVAQFPKLSRRYIGKLLSLRLVLFVVYALVILTIGFTIGFKGNRINILIFLIINQFLLSTILFFRSYFSGMLLFVLDAFFSVFDKVVLIFICGYFLYVNTTTDFTIYHFIFSQTAAYILSLGIALLILARKIGFQDFKIQPNFSIAIFKKALPFALLILLMTIYTRIDAVMLERLHPNGEFETGLYAQAYRILDAFVMFTMLFNTLLFPIFSTQIAKKENIQPLLKTSSKLLFALSLSVVIGCIYFANDILHLFYRDIQPTSVLTFQILIVAFLPISAIQIFGTLHTASGNLRFLNIISLIGIVISVSLNLVLIHRFGAISTAITCVVTHGVISFVQIIYTKKYFHLKVDWKTIFALLVYGILLVLLVEFAFQFNAPFVLKFVLFAVTALVLSVLLKLIHIKDMRQFIKARE